nr:MAG TPA: hypothetical protein [Caudoviricetes sp.]
MKVHSPFFNKTSNSYITSNLLSFDGLSIPQKAWFVNRQFSQLLVQHFGQVS